MKALSLTNREMTRQTLLALAKQIPGAWIGIKITALLLVLEGQRPGWINALFGLDPTTLERWIHQVNKGGGQALIPKPRPGRPSGMSSDLQARLKRDLEESPHKFGLPRAAWDGPTVVVYLKERFGVKLKVRQAQNWMHRLGYSLKRASYVYVQARKKDARAFGQALKKTANPEPPKGDYRVSG
jgi:transposase